MSTASLDPKLLELLRCPVAVRDSEGDDPGRLELVNDEWLVCHENNHKYPIVDGIPVMLPDEGAHWKDIAVEDLPSPPVAATTNEE
jgi:uncharacterized protein